MNYLAHLHIAQYCQSSLLGNLLGDFVKGSPDTQFSAPVAQGVKLHRFVDSYTDRHELVLRAKGLFPNGTRRFSGIALDMFWDHCLAKRWNEFHDQPLALFCQQAQQTVEKENADALPERFTSVTSAMWQGRWLESYQDISNIEFALERMSLRTPRMSILSQCFPLLEQHYSTLNETFSLFYSDVLTASRRF